MQWRDFTVYTVILFLMFSCPCVCRSSAVIIGEDLTQWLDFFCGFLFETFLVCRQQIVHIFSKGELKKWQAFHTFVNVRLKVSNISSELC